MLNMIALHSFHTQLTWDAASAFFPFTQTCSWPTGHFPRNQIQITKFRSTLAHSITENLLFRVQVRQRQKKCTSSQKIKLRYLHQFVHLRSGYSLVNFPVKGNIIGNRTHAQILQNVDQNGCWRSQVGHFGQLWGPIAQKLYNILPPYLV